MSCREIVTLQIGHYSNFVGTHWWNLQEASFVYDPKLQVGPEVNHDVLFREGKTLMGDVTYTPRLVAVDLKGSLNTLKQEGTLYDVKPQASIDWVGDVTLHKSIPAPKNKFLEDLERQEEALLSGDITDRTIEVPDDMDVPDIKAGGDLVISEALFGPKFYDLDDHVTVWSDYLHTHLHPRSNVIVQEYAHRNDVESFDVFGCGESIMSNYSSRRELEDSIHFFTEESDNLQGFHILSDTFNGFGGLSSRLTQYLQDEFPKKAYLTLGTCPAVFPNMTLHEHVHRIINSLFSYTKMAELSSLFVPVSMTTTLWDPKVSGCPVKLPYLKFRPELSYHTSAVLAAALDTMSLPYRLEGKSSRLTDITHCFHQLGRRVAALSASLPFPLATNSTLVDSLMSRQGQLPWSALTPGVTGNSLPFMQSVVLRGIPETRVKSAMPAAKLPRLMFQCDASEDVLQLYLTEMFPSTLNAGRVVNQACKVTSPYPHLFESDVNQFGQISDKGRPEKHGVESVPVMTSLQSSPEIKGLLEQLNTAASRINIKQYHKFLENGLEEDDYAESLEHLNSLLQCYDST